MSGTGVIKLDRAQSMALLGTVRVGRIIFTDRAMPAVAPVSFIVNDDAVLLSIPTCSRLLGVATNSVIAFEADGFADDLTSGWWVSIVGTARTVDAPADMPAGLTGDTSHVLRIDSGVVSGHQMSRSAPVPR